MRYNGYYIDQADNGSWFAVDDTSGIDYVVVDQRTQQDCVNYIDEFLIKGHTMKGHTIAIKATRRVQMLNPVQAARIAVYAASLTPNDNKMSKKALAACQAWEADQNTATANKAWDWGRELFANLPLVTAQSPLKPAIAYATEAVGYGSIEAISLAREYAVCAVQAAVLAGLQTSQEEAKLIESKLQKHIDLLKQNA